MKKNINNVSCTLSFTAGEAKGEKTTTGHLKWGLSYNGLFFLTTLRISLTHLDLMHFIWPSTKMGIFLPIRLFWVQLKGHVLEIKPSTSRKVIGTLPSFARIETHYVVLFGFSQYLNDKWAARPSKLFEKSRSNTQNQVGLETSTISLVH